MTTDTAAGRRTRQRGAQDAGGAHPLRLTERQLQDNIVDAAGKLGWYAYHTFLSVRSAPGFPDLVLCRASRLLMIECKSATGKLSPHQEEWLGILGGVPCVEVCVWRPEQWFDGTVERVLQ